VAIEEIEPVVAWDGVAVNHAAVWAARVRRKRVLAYTAGVAVVGRLRHCELRCVVELMGDCGDQNCDEGVSAGDLRREIRGWMCCERVQC
jgi:hypothetical protein